MGNWEPCGRCGRRDQLTRRSRPDGGHVFRCAECAQLDDEAQRQGSVSTGMPCQTDGCPHESAHTHWDLHTRKALLVCQLCRDDLQNYGSVIWMALTG